MSYVLEGPPQKLYDIAEILLKLALNTNLSINQDCNIDYILKSIFLPSTNLFS